MIPRDLSPSTVVPDIHLNASDNSGLYAHTVSILLTEPTLQEDSLFESMYIYFNSKASYFIVSLPPGKISPIMNFFLNLTLNCN